MLVILDDINDDAEIIKELRDDIMRIRDKLVIKKFES